MFAVMCFAATLDAVHLSPEGLKFRPAPIPDRWLLKYAPQNLPRLPDRFFDGEWHYGFYPRSLSGAYTEWTKFARDSLAAPAEATLTHAGRGFNEVERSVSVRRVPLAVYGPLVEYDGNLNTVALTNWETDPAKKPVWRLNIGAAVEVRKNVWYQAGSERLADGKVRVREYRLEFADDPRTSNSGKVKVFTSERLADTFDRESTAAEGEFEVPKAEREPRRVMIAYRAGGGGVRRVTFHTGDGRYAPVIESVSHSGHAVLTEAPSPAPKPPNASPPGLMQPPKKPQK